jgi:hypothetical protein
MKRVTDALCSKEEEEEEDFKEERFRPTKFYVTDPPTA